MTKKLKPMPHFHSEAEEREFWESHDSTDYVDWSNAQRAHFPNLRLSSPVSASAKPRKEGDHDSD
jgi:hypothetical protein